MMIATRRFVWLALTGCMALPLAATAQQEIDAHFSCGAERDDNGLHTFFSDNGRIRIKGDHIEEFSWESSAFRSNLGIECSIDQGDDLVAEFSGDDKHDAWLIHLKDAAAAREKRGYDFAHGLNCTVNIERHGDTVHIAPSCPALCGSRQNFSEVSFDLKTGACRYEK